MSTPQFVVGLAGGIGSGKSTIANLFAQLGVEFVDADDVARQVVEPDSPCLKAISQRYGPEILLKDGTLNRRALRDIVFDEPSERLWLESITHPEIKKRILMQIQSAQSAYVLLVHPLLFETGQNAHCDITVAISVPESLQIDRVCQRDQVSREQAEKIVHTQLSDKERTKQADYVLENTGNTIDLNDKVNQLHSLFLQRVYEQND